MTKKYKVSFALSYWTMAEDEQKAEQICREILKQDLEEMNRSRDGIYMFGSTVEEEFDEKI
jgi:hypothetical protein